eukprot:CAMPEP_0172326056 /NCGR_PEP_ID=MMETSP1058-20130122/55460_1 /TAXON_ID=83371 /ORGANISM="Detonula confervacea, Strain CCMP 353" /LENGTH=109 /DNA_ID=CAMNT_0013042749 /DNA_START=69 /DNA_END=394 /DNA_ORIENTATION=-
MAMQRFTVKISFQPGRKLGFVLNDYFVEPESYYESDDFDDEHQDLSSIHSGESSLDTNDPVGDDEDRFNSGGGGVFSLQSDFAAEAAAAAEASPGRSIPPPANKRKRST